ncbi:hypothetical protein KPZU09_76150 [Klebsiella pneumoniae]|uniref:AP endonuclease, family 2 n=1 Tax=Klebsiella pneumoniae TaxID=573 RepID=A0A919I083_KLEPN|nr:hypothetical protein KPZU09_76150 [Klebsiella pneumoniae]
MLPAQHETPEQHLARLQSRFAEASGLNPRFVNLLAGNDRWPLAQQVDFLGKAHELAAGFGLTCSFETHRATSLYSPWLTLEIIQQLPQLRFTADISHWVVVSERLLDDPSDDFSAFIDRVHHVQARVGYDRGRRCRTRRRLSISRRWLCRALLAANLAFAAPARLPADHADPGVWRRRLSAPSAVHQRSGGRSLVAQRPDGRAPAGQLSAVLSLTEQEPQP